MAPRSKQCYIVKPVGAATVAFVPVPKENRWMRCSPCVVVADCPECGAAPGIPCTSTHGYNSTHHIARSHRARSMLRGGASEGRLPALVLRIDEISLGPDDLKTLIRSVLSGREE